MCICICIYTYIHIRIITYISLSLSPYIYIERESAPLEEYGIRSFVYRARRPFHPSRFAAWASEHFAFEDAGRRGRAFRVMYICICIYIYIYIYIHIKPEMRGWRNTVGNLIELCSALTRLDVLLPSKQTVNSIHNNNVCWGFNIYIYIYIMYIYIYIAISIVIIVCR